MEATCIPLRGPATAADASSVAAAAAVAAVKLIILLGLQSVTTSASTPTMAVLKGTQPSPPTCRDRAGLLDVPTYRLSTCAGCYGYLFPRGKQLKAYMTWLVSINATKYTFTEPDIHNDTIRAEVCRTLNKDECRRWQECCTAAEQCCQRQLGQPPSAHAQSCPRTWDGFHCWEDTQPGHVVATSCPEYIPHTIPTLSAYKTCTENATWFTDPVTYMEWTNYTKCLSFDEFKVDMYIALSCNLASLIVLVPSTIIFLVFRQLWIQHRIRLHINLFVSFILFNFLNILWDWVVIQDRLTTPTTQTIMYLNTVTCRVLYVALRYSRSTNFLWMFCEGFYLHRLIVKAFEPPKRLFIFYLIGWGLPVIPLLIYSSVRAAYADANCWVQNFAHWEWMVYVPNLLSLAANMIFLVAILRILLTQLSTHPNEPSSYRRAFKATFVLVPLFGLQLFLIMYRPPYGAPGARALEIMSALITNSQGLFVALIFCLLNGEVMGLLKRNCGRFHYSSFEIRRGRRASSMHTQTSEVISSKEASGRDKTSFTNDKRYIAMKPIANGSSTRLDD